MNKRVTGIGGIFFKAKDPKALGKWYADHLGIDVGSEGNMSIFDWRYADDPDHKGQTIWSAFGDDTDYFGGGESQFMINYRVEDMDAVLAALKSEGVEIIEETPDSEYGRFAWIRDPEGRRIELWQEPKDA